MDWFYIFVFCICTWSLRKQIIYKWHDIGCGEEKHLTTGIFSAISNKKALRATSKAFPKSWKGSDGIALRDHFYMHSAKYFVQVSDVLTPTMKPSNAGITFPFHSLTHIHRISFLSVNVKKYFVLGVIPSLSQPYYLKCGCRQYICLWQWIVNFIKILCPKTLVFWLFSNHLKLHIVLKTQRPSLKQTW